MNIFSIIFKPCTLLGVSLLFAFTAGASSLSPQDYRENTEVYYRRLVAAQGFEPSLAQFHGEFRNVAELFKNASEKYIQSAKSTPASELGQMHADFFIQVDETVRKYLVGIIFSLNITSEITVSELAAVHKEIMEPSFLMIEETSAKLLKEVPKELYSSNFQGFLTGAGGDYHSIGQVSVSEVMELVNSMNGELRIF